ncbi:MAG: hypothetical protein J0M07_24425 [Anaerolineae bacterium]|jgi:ribosome-binding protein aMBF1 (putative translation factor)|nr:hypothetical protein [Chloroflexota bacterium]MBN8638481.1 hypothetical protein [Anaerolineae bacterium]
MGKSHRGKGLYKMPAHGRGTCPICGRTRIKLLYPVKIEGAQKNVCKNCRNTDAT